MSDEVLRGKMHSISTSNSPRSFETIMHAHQFLLINDCIIENYAISWARKLNIQLTYFFKKKLDDISVVFTGSQMKWCLAPEVYKSYSADCRVFTDEIFHYWHRS